MTHFFERPTTFYVQFEPLRHRRSGPAYGAKAVRLTLTKPDRPVAGAYVLGFKVRLPSTVFEDLVLEVPVDVDQASEGELGPIVVPGADSVNDDLGALQAGTSLSAGEAIARALRLARLAVEQGHSSAEYIEAFASMTDQEPAA